MTDKFDPITNRVPWGLLTEQERNVLTEWQHGIEFYNGGAGVQGWYDTNTTTWNSKTVYRGKPAPVVTSKWINVYLDGFVYLDKFCYEYNNRAEADRRANPIGPKYRSNKKKSKFTDGRPCNTDEFLAVLLAECDDHYDRLEAIQAWLKGDWDEACEGLSIELKEPKP
jgi:hypothetical protein